MCEHPEFNINICVDCLCYVANGDIPEDRPNLPAEIKEQWPDEEGQRWEIVPSCPENCEGFFSRWRCEGCGSYLGGERHPAVAFRRPANAATQR